MLEVLVAASVLLIGILGTFGMVDSSQRMTQKNTSRTAAANLGREILEHARSLDYEQLAPATLVTLLRTKPGLQGQLDAQGRWVVSRGGVKVAVSTSVCTADDPLDGLSSTPPQNACPAAAAVAGAPAETNPDDFRRVTLTLAWAASSENGTMTQTGMIANPGGGLGPRVTDFPDPFTIQVTTGVSIPFVVSTTTATTVRWSMDDGISAGDAIGGPRGWTFTWALGTVGVGTWTVDGTYTANVQPFDSRGVPGERRAATVLLNRRIPMAPAQFSGGRSESGGGVVELEWASNPERDILGYRVYRIGSTGGRTRICPAAGAGADAVTRATSCTDPNPLTIPVYSVVAVDRPTLGDPSSGTREGDASALTVPGLGARPNAPTGLAGAVTDGRVHLTWLPPIGVVPIFYRIYRDGVRVDRTATPLPSWTDSEPSQGTPHKYAVTAVSALYNESVVSTEVEAG